MAGVWSSAAESLSTIGWVSTTGVGVVVGVVVDVPPSTPWESWIRP